MNQEEYEREMDMIEKLAALQEAFLKKYPALRPMLEKLMQRPKPDFEKSVYQFGAWMKRQGIDVTLEVKEFLPDNGEKMLYANAKLPRSFFEAVQNTKPLSQEELALLTVSYKPNSLKKGKKDMIWLKQLLGDEADEIIEAILKPRPSEGGNSQ